MYWMAMTLHLHKDRDICLALVETFFYTISSNLLTVTWKFVQCKKHAMNYSYLLLNSCYN